MKARQTSALMESNIKFLEHHACANHVSMICKVATWQSHKKQRFNLQGLKISQNGISKLSKPQI